MNILVGISTYGANLTETSGGSERQALGNAEALADRGLQVYYKNLLWKAPDWGRDYDIIHLINANGPNGPYQFAIQGAHDRDIPVVLSPVFWPVEEMKEEMMTGQVDSDAVLDLYFQSFLPVVKNADVLLPNAENEMRKVEEFADTTDLTYQVVPNAIDLKEIEHTKNGQAPDEWGDYVLCVGRMEPRKNQHRLMQAMEILWAQDYDLNLVLIGSPNHKYLERFEDIFEGHDDKLFMTDEALPTNAVLSAMADAEVLAMPSWLETPGLVALEAAALGTDIVPTSRGTTHEYFGDLVNYCEPDQAFSIAEGIKKAVERETPSELQEMVLERYNYDRVGELNEMVYREVLND